MNIKELIKNNKYICNSDNKNYMEITEFKDNKKIGRASCRERV